MQTKYPHILSYESRQSADLELNAALLGKSFGDTELAAFAPLSGRIVWADLSRTAITDRSAPVLAAMKNIRVLRLMRTAISDATAPALVGLDHLNSLNLFGTATTAAALIPLARLRGLQHLYVGETKIPADAACPDALRAKLQFQKTVPMAPPAAAKL